MYVEFREEFWSSEFEKPHISEIEKPQTDWNDSSPSGQDEKEWSQGHKPEKYQQNGSVRIKGMFKNRMIWNNIMQLEERSKFRSEVDNSRKYLWRNNGFSFWGGSLTNCSSSL